MTRIDGMGTVRTAARSKAARGARASAFVLPEAGSAGDEEAVRRAAAPSETSVAAFGMLALQEQAGGAITDREARRHGQELLRTLAELQIGLLGSRTDPAALVRLANLANAGPEAADPRLQQIVQAIALRARIELARLASGAVPDRAP